MTDLEKLRKVNSILKDSILCLKNQAKEMKEEIAELRAEIKFTAKIRSCPALLDAQQAIIQLEKKIAEYEDYERNNLLKESKNATHRTD
jgi:hypothetical protein